MESKIKKEDVLNVSARFTVLSELSDPANWWKYLLVEVEPDSYQEVVQTAFANMVYWKIHGRDATSIAELEADETTRDKVALMLANMRMILSMDAGHTDEPSTGGTVRRNDIGDVTHMAAKVKTSMKPAPEGTVAELAEKYDKSKSEIRKLKREGRLTELTNAYDHL